MNEDRSDDSAETIKTRLDKYTHETKPVLDYYQKQNLLYEIDGTGNIHEIYMEISRIIHPRALYHVKIGKNECCKKSARKFSDINNTSIKKAINNCWDLNLF